jgi:LPPG:FO 2-phospho-L-lactate transferase
VIIDPLSHYTVLAGGTGAAKFLRGLVRVIPPEQIHVIVNVGDDLEMWGLHVSPDIDSVLYALADRLDWERGWGMRDETFRCLSAMERLGQPVWFKLGDSDLATHVYRTEMLRAGRSLSDATDGLARAMSVRSRLMPATNDHLRTRIETPHGWLDFQEFFVRERWQPDVRSVAIMGAAEASAPERVIHSIREARAVIVAPSNPITSIGPILAIPAIRDALRCTRAEVVAVSPIIGNAAVSGPAAKLMEACGHDVSAEGVARCYHDFLDLIVIDNADAGFAASIRSDETIAVEVTDILIKDVGAAARLAEFVVAKAHENGPPTS